MEAAAKIEGTTDEETLPKEGKDAEVIDLFKLEKLELLKSLDQLNKLDSLNELKSLDQLRELEKLNPLSEILSKLNDLKSLDKLDSLHTLSNLEQLKELEKLSEFSHLSDLKPLENLQKLEELQTLNKLDQLASLDKLKELSHLTELSQLKELERLQVIKTLSELLENHKEVLTPLIYLEKMKELHRLQELERLNELGMLNKLEELSKLDKLDRIDDARFAERLNQLDKLHILERGTRTLVIQQVVGVGLEILKITVAGILIVFMLSRETGREVAVKALPALGFGSAAQVNLGLKLLLGETSPEHFQELISDLRKRVDSEITSIFSTSPTLKINRRLELLSQVQSYSFQGAGINLSLETKDKLEKSLMKMHEAALSRIQFDMSLARGRQDAETETRLREIKLLLDQKQFPQLLEKALPLWGQSEAITMAGVTGLVALKIQDPKTLDEVMRVIPGNGVL